MRRESGVEIAPEDTGDDIFLRAARILSSLSFEDALDDLILAVTELLDCQIGILGAYVDSGGVPSIETTAFCINGRLQASETYPLSGTPCDTVIGSDFGFYPDKVGYLFPKVAQANQRIEGYAAYPLVDRVGKPLGILTVMSYSRLTDRDRFETLLRLFADRAIAELERKAAADALRVSRDQYQAVFDASMDGLVLLKTDGTIVDVNQAIEQMYLFSRSELRGRPVLEVLARNRRAAGEHFLANVLKIGYAETTDIATRADGTTFRVEPRAVLMDYEGETHVLAIVRDVTQSTERDQALRDSESLLRATVEAGLDCIIVMDAEGRIVEFNPSAERCFGYTREAVINRDLASLIIPERFRAAHQEGLERFLADGTGPYIGQRSEQTAMRADGTEFPVELTIGVASSGPATVFVGYLRDITERRSAEVQRQTLEAQLRQAQKMEALGHLTGGIAHDFNNILTSVLGYVDMAADIAETSASAEKLKRYLNRARLSSERARDLVQQMLTFSRGQSGETQVLDLRRAIQDAMYLLEATMPATVNIETIFEPDLPKIDFDPVQLEQVLVNLCINARDAMDGNGSLRVSVRHTPATSANCSSCHQPAEGTYVEFDVIDDGPGLSEALIERIFEPFFSTKEATKGSGMGLSSVHGIVHEHGGHLVVESTPGEGACFRVLLPVAGTTRSAGNNTDDDPEALPDGELQGRVMIVDDNLEVAEFLDELLTGWGLTTRPFISGRAALDSFLHAPSEYDVVISDQTMPEITGMELARAILTEHPGTPFILHTGYSEAVTESSALEAGIHALFAKPLDIPRLKGVLEGILGSN